MRVIELREDGLEAFVVIDHDQFPIAAGGTRMLPDVDIGEVARLARAMTWKFAIWRVPYSGAKAGVRFAGGGSRDEVMAAYRRALEPYRGVFVTGPDMGTSPADFADGLDGPPPLWAQQHEGVDMDDLATGHGVKAAAEAALAHAGRALPGAAIAIEGFGKVGAGMALASARAGARIVGVSTVDGLLADPDGLDVSELFALRERFGDALVAHGPAPVRPREELFELDCDVLVPGARPDSITREVAGRLRCAAVAPGANVPYGPGAVEELHRRGIIAVPDFIANAGGIHLYTSVAQAASPVEALGRIEALIHDTVTRTLVAADEHASTPLAAAFRAGRDFLAESGADDTLLDELFAAS
jgi:glutamate dehydrogenase (NAD(P)+)